MRYAILGLCLIATVTIGGCTVLLLAAGGIQDYRWVFVAAPVFLLVAREVSDRVLNVATGPYKQWYYELAVEPEEDEEPDVHPGPDHEDFDETAQRLVGGLWTGTARIWPTAPDDVMRTLPLRLAFHHRPIKTQLIPSETADDHPRIVAADIIEYDESGDVDLRLVIDEAGRHQTVDTKLTLRSGRLVPDDETDAVTVELQRARFVPVGRRIGNPVRRHCATAL